MCFGLTSCWQHTLQTHKVRVRESLIPNAGKGLFCFVRGGGNQIVFRGDHAQQRWICPYGGENTTQAVLDTRYSDCTAPYGLAGSSRAVDAASVRGIGSMANGGTLAQSNTFYSWRGGQLNQFWLKCRPGRNIRNGQEIVVYYGPDYRFDDVVHSTKRAR